MNNIRINAQLFRAAFLNGDGRGHTSLRVLLITLHYPPISGMSSRAMAELSRKLVANGHSVDVLTVDCPPKHPIYKRDYREMLRVPTQAAVHRVPMGLINRISARFAIGDEDEPQSQRGVDTLGKLRSLLRKLYLSRNLWQQFAVPDASFDWLPAATIEARRMIRRRAYDVLVSLGNPHTCHLIAYLTVKRQDGPAWVVIYGDGWGTDPSLDVRHRWNRSINRSLERKVLQRADRIVVCSDGIVPHLVSHYGVKTEKVSLARFCFFDAHLYDTEPAARHDGFRIVYTGAFYSGLHDLRPLLNACKHVGGAVRFTFFGLAQDAFTADAKALGVTNAEFLGWRDYNVSVQEQKGASVLLLLGHRGGQQLPSKLYEYFSARRPILCITADPHDIAATLVRAHNRGIVVMNSEADIADAVKKLAALYAANALDSEFDLRDLPEYTPDRSASEMMRAVVAASARRQYATSESQIPAHSVMADLHDTGDA